MPAQPVSSSENRQTQGSLPVTSLFGALLRREAPASFCDGLQTTNGVCIIFQLLGQGLYNNLNWMSKASQGKALTPELIFTKTKSDSLHNIKNLNLWGNDLEDLSLIEKMPSLQVVSLSVNRISSLKYFAGCAKLQELYLRKNNIADIREIRHLVKLPSLKVLWLHDNPCAQTEGYRDIVIKYLPNLLKLDNNPVTPEDKISCQGVSCNLFGGPGEDNYRTEPPQHHQSSHSQQYRQLQEEKWQRPSTAQSNSSHKPAQSPSSNLEQKNYSVHGSSQAEERSSKKGMARKPHPDYAQEEKNMSRNQNILMAILSLMRELDPGSLEILRREADRMLE